MSPRTKAKMRVSIIGWNVIFEEKGWLLAEYHQRKWAIFHFHKDEFILTVRSDEDRSYSYGCRHNLPEEVLFLYKMAR